MWRTFEPIPSICAPSDDEEAAEILDVRLAGGMADDRLSLGEDGGHDRVLRAHDRRLVEVHALAAEPVRPHLVGAVELDLDPELLERVDVGVEAPAADHVAAGRRHGHAPEAGEQRAGEQERGADLPTELRVELGPADALRIDPDLVRSRPLDVGADVGEQRDHGLHVLDPRHVGEPDLARRENAGREDRERAVLVPRRPDAPAERTPALDHEGLHRAGNGTDRLHGIRVSGREVLDLELRERVGRLEPENLGVERELGLERADDVLGLAESVALSFEEQVRVWDAALAKRPDDQFRLERRDDLVVGALEHEHRRRDPVGEVDRAARPVQLRRPHAGRRA